MRASREVEGLRERLGGWWGSGGKPDLSMKGLPSSPVLAEPLAPVPSVPHPDPSLPQLRAWHRLLLSSLSGGLHHLKGPALRSEHRPGLSVPPLAWWVPKAPVTSPGMELAAASPLTSSPRTSCLYRLITWVRLSLACRISAGMGRRGEASVKECGGF